MAEVEILLECPAVPADVERDYREFIKRKGLPADDEERWDQALDFVMFGLDDERVPWDEDVGEADVDCMREWAFELMRRIGEPYPGQETLEDDVRFVGPEEEIGPDVPVPRGGRWPKKNEELKRKLMRG